jgi:hypothetical protein
MSGAIPPLPQHAFMAWCLVKAQGQLYLFIACQTDSLSSERTEMYLRGTICEDVDWIHLAQDTIQGQAPVNTVMKLRHL